MKPCVRELLRQRCVIVAALVVAVLITVWAVIASGIVAALRCR